MKVIVQRNEGKSRFDQAHPVEMRLGQTFVQRIALSVDEARQLVRDLEAVVDALRPEPKRLSRILWSCGPCEIVYGCVNEAFYVKDKGTGEVLGQRGLFDEAVDLVRDYCKVNRRHD